MAWLVRRIVDLFNALAASYYRRKYGAVAKRLGRLPDEEVDGRRGFIVLEIDGLAHPYLLRALEQGDMPYLARLLRDGTHRLAGWQCGLPSTTPAAQAGILYGNNWDIPGFRWYDKASGTSIMCKLPGSVRAVQERISAGRVGLLRGGSSYTNMFDGDARLALFTLGSLGGEHFFENVRGLGFVILFALSPLRIVRIIALSLWTWLVYIARRLASSSGPIGPISPSGPPVRDRQQHHLSRNHHFQHHAGIYRGMPSIYASYTGYDEIAHHFGADSREAFRALRGLDNQIRQIDRMRRLYVRREYDLYVLSDGRPDALRAVPAGFWPDVAAVYSRPHWAGGAQWGAGRRQREPGSGTHPLSGRRDPEYRKPAAPGAVGPAVAGYPPAAGGTLAARIVRNRLGPQPADRHRRPQFGLVVAHLL